MGSFAVQLDSYLLFLLVAMVTVLSPGPGVILTLTNTMRFGVSGAAGGIFGIAFGTFIVAGIAATGLGVILATSAIAFNVMKYVGAGYLLYLGVKLWHSPPLNIAMRPLAQSNRKRQFVEGLMLQLTNPKAVFFFLSVFPQFVNFADSDNSYQFLLLVVTYSSLVVLIHFAYAGLAKKVRLWLVSENGGRRVNRIGGGTFICFGIGLASANH